MVNEMSRPNKGGLPFPLFFQKKLVIFQFRGQICIVFRFVVYVYMYVYNTAYVYIVDIYIFGHV